MENMNSRGGVRPGAGRKSKGLNPRVQLSCLVSPENKEYIQTLAHKKDVSISDLMEEIIHFHRGLEL